MKVNKWTNFNLFSLFSKLIPDSDCYLCLQPVKPTINQSTLLCQYCHERLPCLPPGCPVCAMPLPGINQSMCGDCLNNAPAFNKMLVAFHYQPPVTELITSLKFHAFHAVAPMLCEYLLASIRKHYTEEGMPTAVIPVPLHSARIRKRGFNQAQVIASMIARQLSIPILHNNAKRIRATSPQTSLNATMRAKNIAGAFRVTPTGQRVVAIVDDVVTTGSTVNELSRELIKSGCEQVHVWTLARAFSIH